MRMRKSEMRMRQSDKKMLAFKYEFNFMQGQIQDLQKEGLSVEIGWCSPQNWLNLHDLAVKKGGGGQISPYLDLPLVMQE